MKVSDLFQQHLDWRAKNGNTEKTLKEVTRFLGNPISIAVGEKSIGDLHLTDTALIREQGRRYGIHGELRAVLYFRALLQYAHRAGIKVPFDYHDIELPKMPGKRVEYYTPEELDQVRQCFDVRTMAGLRTRTLLEFLLDTGLRIGEAISLNRDSVNFETLEVVVRNIKTHEWDTVCMTERSAEWLKTYLAERKDNDPALFISGRARLTACTSRNYIRSKTKHLSFQKKICHHIMRRTLPTILLQEGVDIKSVQSILRHKSERTTLRYYVGVNKEKARKLQRAVLDRLFGHKTLVSRWIS